MATAIVALAAALALTVAVAVAVVVTLWAMNDRLADYVDEYRLLNAALVEEVERLNAELHRLANAHRADLALVGFMCDCGDH